MSKGDMKITNFHIDRTINYINYEVISIILSFVPSAGLEPTITRPKRVVISNFTTRAFQLSIF